MDAKPESQPQYGPVIVSEAALALDEHTIRPYQVVALTYADGRKAYEFSRYLSVDSRQWIRHGVFQAFYLNGNLKSEGTYQHGAEEGTWRDYFENGQVAAEGSYRDGKEHGTWLFWQSDGALQERTTFVDGLEVQP